MTVPVSLFRVLVLSCLITFNSCSTQGKNPDQPEYRDVILTNDKPLVVGTNGKIDYYEAAGNAASLNINTTRNLNSVIAIEDMIFVVGDGGTIFYSDNGQQFSLAETGMKENINGITLFKNLLVAGADNGIILISLDGKTWDGLTVRVRGNIASVSSNENSCYGVTDAGEIISSDDGLNWKVTDYNKEYAGYARACVFKKVIAINDRIAVTGEYEDGSPAVLFSSLGSVWSERKLNYEDESGQYSMLENAVNDIAYDKEGDQFLLACDDGEVMILPSCSKCNEMRYISDKDIFGIIVSGNTMFLVGEDYSFQNSRLR
ncbi:MAG TPA: hypothetical protein VHO50_03025 [Bacteroidales bacterium]|nr:hypothetical protein [Bacteroidales bacterium]